MSTFYDFDQQSFQLLPENVQLNLCIEVIWEHETRDPDYIKHVLLHSHHWLSMWERTDMWLRLGLEAVW